MPCCTSCTIRRPVHDDGPSNGMQVVASKNKFRQCVRLDGPAAYDPLLRVQLRCTAMTQASLQVPSTSLVPHAAPDAWDGHLPWPRYPSFLATAHLSRISAPVPVATSATAASSTPSRNLRAVAGSGNVPAHCQLHGFIARCEAVLLRQWPELCIWAQGMQGLLAQAAQGTRQHTACSNNGPDAAGSSYSSKDTNTSSRRPLQPWAMSPVMTLSQQPAVAQGSVHVSPETDYGNISFSGWLDRKTSHSLNPGQHKLPKLEVASASAPYFRFIEPAAEKLLAATQPTGGGDMYDVRQPEWRPLVMSTGSLTELAITMTSWSTTRLLGVLPLATISAAPATTGTACNEGVQRPWHVFPDATTALRLGTPLTAASPCRCQAKNSGTAQLCVHCLLGQLAAWLPALLQPVNMLKELTATGLTGATMPQMAQCPWASARLQLRWSSCGSLEPLKAHLVDRLILQVHGACRVLLVPPEYALHGLAPLPAAHPYVRCSAPGLAATSRAPVPSRATPVPYKAAASNPGTTVNEHEAEHQHALGSTVEVSATEQNHSSKSSSSKATPAAAAAVAPSSPSPAYLREEQRTCQAVCELWPEFRNVKGQVAVLQAGDALWLPAGWSLHTETLFEDGQYSGSTEPGDVSSTAPHNISTAGLPGCVQLECDLLSTDACSAPRAVGALQLRAAELIEQWAVRDVTHSAARVRLLLLDLADRLEAAGAGTQAAQKASAAGADRAADKQDVGVADTCSWVTFPAGPEVSEPSVTHNHTLGAHWLDLSSCNEQMGQQGSGKQQSSSHASSSSTSSWRPCWSPSTLRGQKSIAFAQKLLTIVAPLAALQQLTGAAGIKESPWPLGAASADFLRCMCAGRLLPTTWLNKLLHNDPQLLKDVPYRYALEYLDEDEAQFPELFQPQLKRREKLAKAAAEAAHLAQLRLAAAKSRLQLPHHGAAEQT